MRDKKKSLWVHLRPDENGLVPAVVQHAQTGQVLMLGYMNQEAFAATLETGRVTFWSRSRNELWEKGQTSGNTLDMVDLATDCDSDALLVLAKPRGPTCHTGRPACFYQQIGEDGLREQPLGLRPIQSIEETLKTVFATILARKQGLGVTSPTGNSYVRSLLTKGAGKIGEKLREEADELADALASEADERVDNEAADLLFHLMVGLALRDRSPEDVAACLAARHGVSGIDEKASRA